MIAQNTQLTTCTHLRDDVTASAAGIGAAAVQLAQASGQQQGAIAPPNQLQDDAVAKGWAKAHGQEEWAALAGGGSSTAAPEVPSNFIPSLMNFAIQVTRDTASARKLGRLPPLFVYRWTPTGVYGPTQLASFASHLPNTFLAANIILVTGPYYCMELGCTESLIIEERALWLRQEPPFLCCSTTSRPRRSRCR
jgi:hypothetical protein